MSENKDHKTPVLTAQDVEPDEINEIGDGNVAIYLKVKGLVCKRLSKNHREVKPGASFTEDLGADSLDLVELIMELEEAFGLEIPDEDQEKIKTVKDVVDYILAHVPAGATAQASRPEVS